MEEDTPVAPYLSDVLARELAKEGERLRKDYEDSLRDMYEISDAHYMPLR